MSKGRAGEIAGGSDTEFQERNGHGTILVWNDLARSSSGSLCEAPSEAKNYDASDERLQIINGLLLRWLDIRYCRLTEKLEVKAQIAKPPMARMLLPVMIHRRPNMSESLPARTKATQVDMSQPELIHPWIDVALNSAAMGPRTEGVILEPTPN